MTEKYLPPEASDTIVRLLNELYENDLELCKKVVFWSLPCNVYTAVHPTIQASETFEERHRETDYVTSFVGILNGLFAKPEIAYELDDETRELKGFCRYRREPDNESN